MGCSPPPDRRRRAGGFVPGAHVCQSDRLARLRITYVLNWALFVATVLVLVSGLLISENVLPALGLPSGRGSDPVFGFWYQVHILSGDTVLVLAAIHLGLNAIKQIFHPGKRHIVATSHTRRPLLRSRDG